MTQNHEAIRQALQNTMHPLDGIMIQEAAGLSEDNARALVSSGQPFILTDVDDSAKDVLFGLLGIKLPGLARYLLIRPLGERSGRTVYHVIESDHQQDMSSHTHDSTSGSHKDPETPPASSADDEPAEPAAAPAPNSTVLDCFASAVARLWDADLLQSLDTEDEPINYAWIYTKTYTVYASGESGCGMTPPTQTLNGNVTYTFQEFLDNGYQEDFQWLYVSTLGYWTTNGMKKNGNSNRGWGNGAVGVTIPLPNVFNFYECSPNNANNVSSVTTTSGFEVGYSTSGEGSASYNFSESQTETLSDWKVTLLAPDNWMYEMSNPYNGNTTKAPSGAVKYSSGKMKYVLKGWPSLTKTTFNWDTMSSWKTVSVLTDTVTVSPTIAYRPNYIHLNGDVASYKECYWIVDNPPFQWTEHFQIDMSKAS